MIVNDGLANVRLANRPFAKALTLFLVNGLILWGVTFLLDDAHIAWWLGGVGATASWWAFWLALHTERTWLPWLECLGLMGASFWIPVFCDPLVRDNRPPPGAVLLIEPSTVLYVILCFTVVAAVPLAIVLTVAGWLTGWRLRSGQSSRVGLRGLFLLTAVVAGHLLAFRPLLVRVFQSPLFEVFDFQFLFWNQMLLTSAALIVLGVALMILGTRKIAGVVCMSVGSLALVLTLAWDRVPNGDLAYDCGSGVVAILLHSVLFSLALRWFGYRLSSGTSATMRNGPPLPPEIFIGSAKTSEPTSGS